MRVKPLEIQIFDSAGEKVLVGEYKSVQMIDDNLMQYHLCNIQIFNSFRRPTVG